MDLKGIKSYTGEEKGLFEYNSPALIIIDMQKGFVYENDTPFSRPYLKALIPPIRKLLDFFRANSLPVAFAEFIYTKSTPCLNGRMCPWEMDTPEGGMRACYLGDETAETIDELKPLPDELVVHKMAYDAFSGTPLDFSLRTRGVKSLVIVGVMADQCLLSTVSGAFNLDYEVAVPSDCTMATSDFRTKATLEIIDVGYGDVFTADEIIEILRMKQAEAG